MHNLTIGDRHLKIASSFDELSNQQIIAYVRDIYTKLPEVFEVVDGKTRIKNPDLLDELYSAALVILLNFDLKTAVELNIPQALRDDENEVVKDDEGKPIMYSSAYALIHDGQICNFFFETFLTKNPVPSLRPTIAKKKLLGPADNFKNLRIEEYFYADKLYLAYRESGNEDMLNRLVATLYRGQKQKMSKRHPEYDGDLREPFNEHQLLGRSSLMQNITHETKYLIYVWYEGCRNQLVRDYPLLFVGGNDSTFTLKPEEELVSLCGGWEKYNTTKHFKIRLLFNDLHAAAKRALKNKKP